MKAEAKNIIKRITDVVLTVLLLIVTAYQMTGEMLHEWFGIAMTVLVIVHQLLNLKWYGALFKGKYHALRTTQTALNILLLLSFALTALCGIAMSGYAVPFMYGIIKASLARPLHLSMSYWTFTLMGLHLGMHIPMMTAKLRHRPTPYKAFCAVFGAFAAAGLVFYIKNGIYKYMLFLSSFAFFDFKKSAAAVFSENLLMLLFWAFLGMLLFNLLKAKGTEKSK